MSVFLKSILHGLYEGFRDQSNYVPSQWETSLHCNDVSLAGRIARLIPEVSYPTIIIDKIKHNGMEPLYYHDMVYDNMISHIDGLVQERRNSSALAM